MFAVSCGVLAIRSWFGGFEQFFEFGVSWESFLEVRNDLIWLQ